MPINPTPTSTRRLMVIGIPRRNLRQPTRPNPKSSFALWPFRLRITKPKVRHSVDHAIVFTSIAEVMALYSYCLRYDDGGAPNPYWGVCSLAICKPAIRRTAQIGDWIVGIGSKGSPIGDISRSVVYAMKVSRVLAMRKYDDLCRTSLRMKIPDWDSPDFSRKMGDCIYEFSGNDLPKVRRSIHTEKNRERDLSGKNVLLSDYFYYFGDKPIQLPESLLPVVHPTQGHKSHLNDAYADEFVEWITGVGRETNHLYGEPQLKRKIESMTEEDCRSSCSTRNLEEDKQDDTC